VTPIDPIAIAADVAAILEDLGIRYVIGGSVASSLMGEPRSTLDLDLMLEAGETLVRRLSTRLKEAYYVDEQDAVESFARGSSFNAIHFATSIKVDFFPAEHFAAIQLDRRRSVVVRTDLPPLYFYAPEDLIVRKLMWFRAGAESSAHQWRDVIGLLKTTGRDLDWAYLKSAAAERDVADLLRSASTAAGIDPDLPS
jgi:hypothetical protein